jgi:D-alanyl-D-alanine dipeptidase
MKYLLLVLALGYSGFSNAQAKDFGKEFQTQQLIVVTAPAWNSTQGTLSFCQLDAQNKWSSIMPQVSVTLGRKGMAWGNGLQSDQFNTGVLKHEGDGKSPAGIFKLTTLFRFGEMESNMNHIQTDSTWYCIDDANSAYYNHLVTTETVSRDWNSAEDMKRNDVLYKFGVVVAYNTDPVQSGDGSCIFLHIWRSSNDATVGCTAMTESNLLMLIQALDKKKNPLVLQMLLPSISN